MTSPDNISKWFSQESVFFGYGEYFESDAPPDISLTHLLNMDQEDLKLFTKQILKQFEEDDQFRELKQGVYAYSQFQDILDVTIQGSDSLFNRHYCYYESLVYLRESVVSWLDKNVLAALALIRPFLELSVLHVYWYLRCQTTGYDAFYSWLNGKKGKPPFRNQLDFVFAHVPLKDKVALKRFQEIKKILRNIFNSMSAYNHSPELTESIVNLNEGTEKYLFIVSTSIYTC